MWSIGRLWLRDAKPIEFVAKGLWPGFITPCAIAPAGEFEIDVSGPKFPKIRIRRECGDPDFPLSL